MQRKRLIKIYQVDSSVDYSDYLLFLRLIKIYFVYWFRLRWKKEDINWWIQFLDISTRIHFRLSRAEFETRASLPVVPDMHAVHATYVQSFDNNIENRKDFGRKSSGTIEGTIFFPVLRREFFIKNIKLTKLDHRIHETRGLFKDYRRHI